MINLNHEILRDIALRNSDFALFEMCAKGYIIEYRNDKGEIVYRLSEKGKKYLAKKEKKN